MAISLDPTAALGWNARGNAYFLLGRFDEALADLKQALLLEPANAETKYLLAQAEDEIRRQVAKSQDMESRPDTVMVTLPPPPVPKTEAPVAEVRTEAAKTEAPPATLETRPPEVAADVKTETGPAAEPAPLAGTPPPTGIVARPAASASALHAEGRKLLQDGQFAQAIVKLSEALETDPSLAQAYNARGSHT